MCAFRRIRCVQCVLLVLCVVTKMYAEGVEMCVVKVF